MRFCLRPCSTRSSIRPTRDTTIRRCWRWPSASAICSRPPMRKANSSRGWTAIGTPTRGSSLTGLLGAGIGRGAPESGGSGRSCAMSALLVPNAIDRLDAAWYQSPFIRTSPNHYAQWASLLLLSGPGFQNAEWEKLGAQILKRFATTEQSPDGYWGEHNSSGPTTGYNHLTLSSVGLYWELTHDPDALTGLATRDDVPQKLHVPGWHARRCDQRSEPPLGCVVLGAFRVFEFSGWPRLRRVSGGLFRSGTSDHESVGTDRARRFVLPRRANRAGAPNPGELFLSDEHARGDTQDRAVAGGAFGIDEHAGDSQPVSTWIARET